MAVPGVPPQGDGGKCERDHDEHVGAHASDHPKKAALAERRAREGRCLSFTRRRTGEDERRTHLHILRRATSTRRDPSIGASGQCYYVTVTQLGRTTDDERCAYCRRPLPPGARGGPQGGQREQRRRGRPPKYCKRSHRQRAYEARRRAARASLPEGQVVVAQSDLDRLHDRLYALEAALDDVTADLSELSGKTSERSRARALEAALAHLRTAGEDLRGVLVEPVVD